MGRLRVPILEDLPDPHGRAVLVRATLDLPFDHAPAAPLPARRAAALAATLGWLEARGARVTVCGDAGGADREEEGRRFGTVQRMIAELSPTVAIADSTGGGGAFVEDPAAIDRLVRSHDLFVNEATQWSHLPLPSLVVPPRRLPGAVGRGLQHDLEVVGQLMGDPGRPFVAVLGGATPLLRLRGLEGLVLRADKVLLGGGLALPMLRAIGKQGEVDVPLDFLAECRRIHGLGGLVAHPIVLPVDLVWERPDGTLEVAPAEELGTGRVVDIGPRTARRFAEELLAAGRVLWLGAPGRVEQRPSAAGTRKVASVLREVGGPVVVGGDALAASLEGEGLLDAVEVVTATDAALELVKNGDLPALAALRR